MVEVYLVVEVESFTVDFKMLGSVGPCANSFQSWKLSNDANMVKID